MLGAGTGRRGLASRHTASCRHTALPAGARRWRSSRSHPEQPRLLLGTWAVVTGIRKGTSSAIGSVGIIIQFSTILVY